MLPDTGSVVTLTLPTVTALPLYDKVNVSGNGVNGVGVGDAELEKTTMSELGCTVAEL